MMNLDLNDLEIYRLAKNLSREGWKIYETLDWRDKKIMGDQFISAVDSMGANIAEGFGRYHFADKNKFNYNARGSLQESRHWLALLWERGKISKEVYGMFSDELEMLRRKLNNYINSGKRQKANI